MKKPMFALARIYLLWAAVVAVLASETATAFAGEIMGFDQVQRTITFQTMNGQTWALAVADSSI